MFDLGLALIKIANNLNKHDRTMLFYKYLNVSCSIGISILIYQIAVEHFDYLFCTNIYMYNWKGNKIAILFTQRTSLTPFS